MLKPTPYRAARYLIVEDENKTAELPRSYLRRPKADPPNKYWAFVAVVFILLAILL